MSAARQKKLVRALALVVLLGAILPNVTYLGHWTVRGLRVEAAAESADGHANHCHGSSACADQAVYGLQWWAEGDSTPSLEGGVERAEPAAGDAVPNDPLIAPPDRPPKYA